MFLAQQVHRNQRSRPFACGKQPQNSCLGMHHCIIYAWLAASEKLPTCPQGGMRRPESLVGLRLAGFLGLAPAGSTKKARRGGGVISSQYRRDSPLSLGFVPFPQSSNYFTRVSGETRDVANFEGIQPLLPF